MKALVFTISLALLLPSFAQAADAPRSDEAVQKYLQLRSAGKKHKEALSLAKREFGVTDQDLDDAAKRLATAGQSVDDVASPAGQEAVRDPAASGH